MCASDETVSQFVSWYVGIKTFLGISIAFQILLVKSFYSGNTVTGRCSDQSITARFPYSEWACGPRTKTATELSLC